LQLEVQNRSEEAVGHWEILEAKTKIDSGVKFVAFFSVAFVNGV